jgi:hypothetical protein
VANKATHVLIRRATSTDELLLTMLRDHVVSQTGSMIVHCITYMALEHFFFRANENMFTLGRPAGEGLATMHTRIWFCSCVRVQVVLKCRILPIYLPTVWKWTFLVIVHNLYLMGFLVEFHVVTSGKTFPQLSHMIGLCLSSMCLLLSSSVLKN